MSRQWFGTDGIRGIANVDLTAEVALRAGRAAAQVLGAGGRPTFLLGRDTRLSGPMLESAVAAGISAAGGEVRLAGVIPTPGIARLVVSRGFSGGVVISASHNSYDDNGIKVFGPDGQKLPDDVELEIEKHMDRPERSGRDVGTISEMVGAAPDYVEEMLSDLEVDLSGLRILLDCAHGATYQVAPLAFRGAGAGIEIMCARPNGTNINVDCGSTSLAALSSHVAQGDFDLGLAFDGDGDRVLAVDSAGREVDGDQMILILAEWLAEGGLLEGNRIVVTSMSNLGLHRAMAERGIAVEVADVGDRYVLERMRETGSALGGEQSGHVIYMPAGPTGDGIQTGLLLAHVVRTRRRSLADLAGSMTRYPQLLRNVTVNDRSRLSSADAVWEAVRVEQEDLGEEGRIVLRPSGTESVVRVMVEAPSEERCREVAERLAAVVERELA